MFIFSGETNLFSSDNLRILNQYLKKNNIDFDTQIQIKNYMNYYWEDQEKQTTNEEQEIFKKLTSNLQEKILLQTNGKILFSIPLFSNNFSKHFLIKLLSIMKPITFDPGSIVYKVTRKKKESLF